MSDKKAFANFRLQFDKGNPAHLQVIDILNRQGWRGKSQYIVNAIQHFENCDNSPDMKTLSRFDEKIIEAVVFRILRDSASVELAKPAKKLPDNNDTTSPMPDPDISFDDAMEELGEDGYNAIMSAMDMFRKE